MTTEQKIQAIRQDFLDRDQDNYVKIRRTGRLGWESLIPQGGNYSDLLRECHRDGDIIKEAYGMARDYIVAMDTPYKVILRLSPEANCTDSRVVYLATRVFDDADLSDGQKIDTFIGLAIHEGCHLKWTDFTQMGEAKNRIIANFINLLEDERIERLCGDTMPGYANYLKSTKYYMFDLYATKMLKKNAGEGLPAHIRLLNAILALVRYPKALRDEDAQEFVDYLYEVREILKEFPKSKEEVTAAAEAIYEVIKKFFEDKRRQQEPSDEANDTSEGNDSSKDGDNSSNDNQDGESEEQGGNPSEEGDTEENDESSEEGNSASGMSDNDSDSKDERNDSGEDDNNISEEVQQALDELEDEMDEMMESLTSDPTEEPQPMDRDEMAQSVRKNSCQLAGICENSVDLGMSSNSVLYKAPENADEYDMSLRAVRKYIPAISNTLRNHCHEYQITYRGMRSGLLDTSKLAEAFQGVQNVYIRQGHVKSDKMAVCVLIDESGSMYGEKIQAARNLAVLLNEAVSAVPGIDLYIYGHTYGDRCRDSYRAGEQITELQVYREKGFAPKKSLGSIEARSGNLDSFAIREAASRMLKFTGGRKNLMFVITDGAPNERYEQLTSTVKQLEKQGMNIVAVCIEPNYDPSQLYTHFVKFTDMSTLALDLGKMIKKAILRNARQFEE